MFLKDWKNNVALLPDVNWSDIYNYLVNTSSEYTQESVKAYKSLKAYEFFVCRLVHDVFTIKLTRTTTFASLDQRYYNLLYKTILKSCVFQGYSHRSRSYNDMVAGVICFLGIVMSTARSKNCAPQFTYDKRYQISKAPSLRLQFDFRNLALKASSRSKKKMIIFRYVSEETVKKVD